MSKAGATAPAPLTSNRQERTGASTRTPPYSREAEKALVGAALLQPHVAIPAARAAAVRPADFYSPLRGRTYELIAEMFEAGEDVDAITVARRLADEGYGASITVADLLGLIVDMPASSHARSYAAIIAADARRRRLITALENALARLWGRA
jgi:replicative DNA helicase